LQEYPLGEEHWINQPVAAGNSESPQLLLQLSVQQQAVEFMQLLNLIIAEIQKNWFCSGVSPGRGALD
jgi:hypothetical protein